MHIARLARRTGRAAALAACLALASLTTPAFADPPGNNGTIKIDNVVFDDDPNNQPHVGCTFQVDFYGYDKGDLFADVTFRSHEPTGPVQVLLTDTVFIGGDDNSGGGSQAGLDASRTYTLDFDGIEPHPQQGFHVKLTINADGSQGADVKHKVFWVEGCPTPTPTPSKSHTPTPSPSPTKTKTHTPTPTARPTPTVSATESTATPTPTVGATESTAAPTPTVGATESTAAPVPTAVPAGTDSPGGGSLTGLVVALVLAAGGAVAGTVLTGRRRRFLHES